MYVYGTARLPDQITGSTLPGVMVCMFMVLLGYVIRLQGPLDLEYIYVLCMFMILLGYLNKQHDMTPDWPVLRCQS